MKTVAPEQPRTLMQAHEELVRVRPDRGASLAVWLEYYQRSVALYEQIARPLLHCPPMGVNVSNLDTRVYSTASGVTRRNARNGRRCPRCHRPGIFTVNSIVCQQCADTRTSRLFNFERAMILMPLSLPGVSGCSGTVSDGVHWWGCGIRRRNV